MDYLTVRGFVLDNRFNYRRDGLPINAETSIPLDNKARVDMLKGPSGMQAGTSAPGGLVNHVVKRPLDAPLRSALRSSGAQRGSVLGAVDLSQRFGADDAFGLRLNAARRAPRPAACATRAATATCSRWPATGASAATRCSKPRSRPATARSRACPASACSATRVPARGRPAPQPQQPAVVAAGGVRRRRPASLRVHAAARRRLAPRRARARRSACAPTTALAFPFGCSDPNPPPDGTYYPTATARRHLRPLRLPQRERAPPQQRARRRAARPARDRPARARAQRSACCARR